MATVYKVRQGESIFDVEGFAALVALAQEGKLSPDDAVFVPASNRWHYARSIRQLREFFPAVEDPPPPPGKVREISREAREQAFPPQPEPPEETRTGDDRETAGGADVVPMRRGRWTPDGKGVEVPVFNYEMDLEPPAAARSLRLLAVAGFALVLAVGLYVYKVGYARYQEQLIESVEIAAPVQTFAPVVTAAGTRPPRPTPAAGESPVPTGTEVAIAATATATPTPLPAFDADGARSKVMSAALTHVGRADQLANAIRSDLIKLAVPVRAVRLDSVVTPSEARGGKSKSKGPVPFELVVEYSLGDEAGTHALHAKHYWMILAMAGRRANELRLNLRSVTVRSFRGSKLSSSVSVTADDAKGVATGAKTPDAVLPAFVELTRR